MAAWHYYNEIDPYAAEWLSNLMLAGHIAPGIIDTRSVEDVKPDELREFTQCHFFAGIGGWPLALRLAGIDPNRRLWTGSCPCQPFSAAGAGAGFADERHLWPAWFHLIRQYRPPVIFGEQVASKAAEPWIDLVHADMEGVDYTFGCVPFPAASVGAPHIRDRNYWVAYTAGSRRGEEHSITGWSVAGDCAKGLSAGFVHGIGIGGVAHAKLVGIRGEGHRAAEGATGGMQGEDGQRERFWSDSRAGRAFVHERLGDSERDGLRVGRRTASNLVDQPGDRPIRAGAPLGPGPTNGFWRNADWLRCTDGKWRPVESGAQQMVDGISRGMGRLRSDHECQEEIADATKAIGLADQILRALRGGHEPTAIWISLGGRLGFPEATLLLASLCEQSRELGRIFHGEASRSAEVSEGSVRKVRDNASPSARSSSGRGYPQQLAWEFGNALPELSQAFPRSAEHVIALRSFTGMPLAHGVPGRVGRLRANGNAIVPQQAAEFILAALDAIDSNA